MKYTLVKVIELYNYYNVIVNIKYTVLQLKLMVA